MADRSLDAEISRLVARLTEAGAVLVDPPVLQPAETLLDLYGEDIRGRAYTTRDPVAGELMLRPDFTVPVVEMHMTHGAEPARYAYSGKVFRTQEDGADRPSEYDQVGFEIFDGSDPVAADAEVFAIIAELLAPLNLRIATGDMGLLFAAVLGLDTTERRKAALLRHVWRPRRFRALLARFGSASVPPARAALLDLVRRGEDVVGAAGPMIGQRTRGEIEARLNALAEDAETPPISERETALIDDIVSLRETMPNAIERLRDIAVDLPQVSDAVERIHDRAQALAARGIDVDALEFEGSYGRTALEYYDGFVFGFYAGDRPDLPPVATGGRYDALTRVLGRGRAIPAVGGVIRPAVALALGART
nr:ATP phosphoribosyltransferase regulatory subunit [Anianabacter salinae]